NPPVQDLHAFPTRRSSDLATAASAYEVLEAGAGLPEVTPLADTVVGDAREAYEGMLVQPTGDYRLASSHELYNFGSLWLSAGGRSEEHTSELQSRENLVCR